MVVDTCDLCGSVEALEHGETFLGSAVLRCIDRDKCIENFSIRSKVRSTEALSSDERIAAAENN